MNPSADKKRLHVVDALRGCALVSIMLLHNLEHFDIFFLPVGFPQWLISLDEKVWGIVFFFFAGKSYGIFALLFGLTFSIQMNSRMKRGEDFRARFAWRLLLLLGFGFINSMFYQGDILMMYAMIGILLIPLAKLSNRALLIIAILLLLQPFEWFNLINGLRHPELKPGVPISWTYFDKMEGYIKGDSLLATMKGNLQNGRLACFHWSWENGRIFHILSLFIFGMLAGRKKLFANTPESKRFWIKALMISVVAFTILYFIKKHLPSLVSSEAILRPLATIETSWTNVAFMSIIISGFYLLFQRLVFQKILNIFSPIGRMSLSNYILQSILGCTIYNGFGFGLYQYTGATFSLLIGLLLAVILGVLSTWWAKSHQRGPLEELWHRATWIDKK